MSTRQRSMPEGTKVSQEWVMVGDLTVDPTYQRAIYEPKVKRMMRDFDPDLIGVLLCSRRDDGSTVVLDGQQRRETVARLWGQNQRVPCLIYHGLSVAQEAEVFVGFNETQTKPRAVDRFRAKVVAGDAACLDIQLIVQRHGLRITTGSQGRTAQCIVTLQQVYARGGPQVLDEAIGLVVAAGHTDDEPLSGELTSGVALLLARYGAVLDRPRLLRTLEEVTPRRITSSARALRAEVNMSVKSLTFVVARLLLDRYNKGLRQKVEWTDAPSDRRWWEPVAVG